MQDRKFEFSNAVGGSAVGVRVVTRCATTELAGRNEDGSIKVRLTATNAGDAGANTELVDFLAAQLGVEAKRLQIVAGEGEREKIISIEGMTTQDVDQRLFHN